MTLQPALCHRLQLSWLAVQDVNSSNPIVRFYYSSRAFMGFCCICCEVLYLALYLHAWQLQRPEGAHHVAAQLC